MGKWLFSFALSLSSKVIATALARKTELMWLSLSPFLGGASLYFHNVIAPHLADPTGWLALKAISLSVALLPLPFAAYFWFRPKLEPTSWGSHQDIKTGKYFCSTCLIPNKVHSPIFLSKDGRFWVCHSNSNHKRTNPDFKAPDTPPMPPPHAQSWMA